MRYVLVLTSLLTLLASDALVAGNWPHWRGPSRNGVSTETGLPVSWGATCLVGGARTAAAAARAGRSWRLRPRGRGRGGFGQGRPLTPLGCADFETTNVAWRLPLPAYSGSTPIIWGDMIFLNVATGANSGELELWAVDRRTQSVAWKRPLADTNHMERKQNMSSPSPVTDGRHVWVMTGVGVLKAFDFAGKEIWSRNIQNDYGRFGLNWGYASSPLLQGDALYVQVLHGMKTDDPSYVLKIDTMTGKTLWRVERPTDAVNESPDSYTTPAWIEANGRAELIITGGDVVSGHDPADRPRVLARRRPESATGTAATGSSPRRPSSADLIIAPTRNNPLVAVRPGGSGDVAAATSSGRSPRAPTCPRPSATARCSTSCATTAWSSPSM